LTAAGGGPYNPHTLPDLPPNTPAKLGRYEIVDELGKGAMGVVYLARDPLIGRLVALKTFHIGYSVKDHELQQFRARFIREAQSAGILSHPAIVTVHDVVEESAEGATFIAMEFVRGTNLKELLQGDEPLAPAFVVAVVSQVAEALDYAHSQGVVHRDIKPANILITADQQVKITDFGIARLDTSNLTVEGQLLGTPNYMAPEQIQGKEVDHRADIFSLGVVVYEMLARRKPFQGDNLTVVTHRIVYEPFTPLEQHVAGLPPAVTDVLQRALEKSPPRRYARAGELAADLRRALSAPAGLNDTMVAAATPPAPRPWLSRMLGRALGLAGPPPVEARSRAQARRLVSAMAALAVGLAAALGGLALLPSDSSADLAAAAEGARGTEILRLLQRGEALLEAGDAAGAAQVLGEAERLAPDPAVVRRLRERAEREAAEQVGARERAAALERGRAALAAGRLEEARGVAEEVLARAPDDAPAQILLGDARAALERRATRQRATVPLPVEPGPAPAPAPPVETEAQAPVADAVLQIEFESAAPEGSLTIYASRGQILREPFRFVRRSGLFRTEAVPGRLERTLAMPPGETLLRVYLALPDRPTQMVERQGNFLPGRSRVLHIAVAPDGEVSARLD
jgi:predicted Ser/Thr protein kinase